jgi:hypothetical protein
MKKVYEAPVIIIEDLISEGGIMCSRYRPRKPRYKSYSASISSDDEYSGADDCSTCPYFEDCENYSVDD